MKDSKIVNVIIDAVRLVKQKRIAISATLITQSPKDKEYFIRPPNVKWRLGRPLSTQTTVIAISPDCLK